MNIYIIQILYFALTFLCTLLFIKFDEHFGNKLKNNKEITAYCEFVDNIIAKIDSLYKSERIAKIFVYIIIIFYLGTIGFSLIGINALLERYCIKGYQDKPKIYGQLSKNGNEFIIMSVVLINFFLLPVNIFYINEQ